MLVINSCAMVISVMFALVTSVKCNEVGSYNENRDLVEGGGLHA